VPTVMNDAVTYGNVFTLLDVNGRSIVGVRLRTSVGCHKCIGRTSAANVEVFQSNVLGQCVGRNICSTDLDHAAGFVPVVQDGPGSRSIPVNHWQLTCRSWNTTNRDRGCLCSLPTDDPLFSIWSRP